MAKKTVHAIRHPIPAMLAMGVMLTISLLMHSCMPANGTDRTDAGLDSLLTPISVIEAAFTDRDSGIIVTVKGTVTRILSDDTTGDRHQRFVIRLSNKQTLLITHNIDVAPRVSAIDTDRIAYVHGEYIWNAEGGLVHWTHHDPSGTHENGWIVYEGSKYE